MKRKLLMTILTLTLVLCSMVGLTACGHEHSYTTSVTAPTCTEQGYTTYTCSCGDSYVDDYVNALGHDFKDYTYNEDATGTENGTETAICDRDNCDEADTRTKDNSALSHNYGVASYTWNGDKCSAIRICANDNTHIETETVVAVYVKDTDVTCDTPETGHYKATFNNSAFEIQETEENTVVNGEPLKHNFGTSTYKWNGNQCTARRVCSRDNTHIETETVVAVYVNDTDDTCDTPETGHYKATFNNSAFEIQETEENTVVNGEPLKHNFGTPTYTWNGNQCAATRVCLRDNTHIETETVTAVYEKDTDATCTEPEKGHYEAVFMNTSFAKQVTNTNSIEKENSILNHDYESIYRYNEKSHYYKCKNCETVCDVKSHNIINKVCICGYVVSSVGLEFALLNANTYLVTGVGNCYDTALVVPNTYNNLPVVGIGDKAFMGCGNLTSVIIPEGVENIGDEAFRGCVSLRCVSLPNSITSIGNDTFLDCSLIYNIKNYLKYLGNDKNPYVCLVGTTTRNIFTTEIDPNCKIIGEGAFGTCTELMTITIPEGIISIGDYAFNYCDSLLNIVIPDSVTNIGYGAFSVCRSLESVTISNSVTALAGSLFAECYSLKTMIIPKNVVSIGGGTFYNCGRLTKIVIPEKVTSIGVGAFRGCEWLTSIEVDSKNLNYKSIDGNLYTKDGTTLVQYSIGKYDTSFTVPNGVKNIGKYAFYGCDDLKNVIISEGVLIIGVDAFYGCTLSHIIIPKSVERIEDYAFYDCKYLSSISFGGTKDMWTDIYKGRYIFRQQVSIQCTDQIFKY